MIIGRNKEISILEDVVHRDFAQLLLVYGRRRVGKTYLINEFFANTFDFKFCGSFRKPMQTQLNNFASEFERYTGKYISKISNWSQAFNCLRDYIDQFPANKKVIIFFDEMPWMDTQKSDFMSSFEYFWNSYGQSKNNLVFIACGSDSSWLVRKIKSNKGGLYNRKTAEIHLLPFNLHNTELFLLNKGIKWSRFTITKLYMVLGGIPYYLNFLKPSLNLNENIDNLLFNPTGQLVNEYDDLYSTILKRDEDCNRILEILSEHPYGLTKSELSDLLGKTFNGDLTNKISLLIDCGIIGLLPSYKENRKVKIMIIVDSFINFYLKFMRKNHNLNIHYWSQLVQNHQRITREALMFEKICFFHLEHIKEYLRIGIASEVFNWKVIGDAYRKGCQIDIVMDRQERIVNLFEVKFTDEEFVIDKEYSENLANKISCFKEVTKTKKDIQLVFISANGIAKSMYYEYSYRNVPLDALFEDEQIIYYFK